MNESPGSLALVRRPQDELSCRRGIKLWVVETGRPAGSNISELDNQNGGHSLSRASKYYVLVAMLAERTQNRHHLPPKTRFY